MGCKYTSADPDSIVRGGPTLTTCFFNRRGEGGLKYHYKHAYYGPPAKLWRADYGLT